jgi:hypothetical protein
MHKQLMLIPLPTQSSPVTELSDQQRKAVRSTLAEALVARIKTTEKEEERDAERQQD